MMLSKLATVPFCAAALLLAIMGAAYAAEVGVTAAVNPSALGTPPGESTRTLVVGNDVFFEERIVTEGSGQTQILFLDQSSLTIGPGSDLVLDEFAYDPDTSVGKMAISVTTGVLRYIGGRIAKQEDVIFTTPHATIGIRGSSLGIDTGADQSIGYRTSGRMFCADDTEVVVITEDGWVCIIDDDGVRVEKVDPAWLKKFLASFVGRDGSPDLPEDEVVEKVDAECGAGAPVVGGFCGDGSPKVPDPKEFDDKAEVEQFIQTELDNNLEPNDDIPQDCEVCNYDVDQIQ
ncbi:MAG: FecR domain-containing protein [Alphaproteobacteria bacterium]|nr:FecR domain-containing protein [Alphaproteobacteria bacterium]